MLGKLSQRTFFVPTSSKQSPEHISSLEMIVVATQGGNVQRTKETADSATFRPMGRPSSIPPVFPHTVSTIGSVRFLSILYGKTTGCMVADE
jgi:hypothetical protein